MPAASDLPLPPPLPKAEALSPAEAKIRIALYRDKTSTRPVSIDVVWPSFVSFLVDSSQACPCTIADGPKKCIGRECPWKSHPLNPDDYMAWAPNEIVGNRLDRNVKHVTMLVLDFDHLGVEAALRVAQALAPWDHIRHTTHNHRAVDICSRAILRLTRSVHADQWHRFLRAAIAFLGVTVADQTGATQPDPTCKNRSRFYYCPSRPCDAPPVEASYTPGKLLDVDEVLAWSDAHLPATPVPVYEDDHVLSETAEWDLDGEHVLSAIDVMARYFPPNRRNDLCLAIGGMLRRAGATVDDAHYIVEEICVQGGSTNPEARAKTVDHTYALSDDSWMTGLTRVAEILSPHLGESEAEAVAKEFGDYLIRARNDALLAGFKPTKTNGVQPGPLASVLTAPVDLATLRSAVTKLATKRASSMERDERIGGILLRRVLDGVPLALPHGEGDVETVLDGETKGVGRERAILKVVTSLAYAFEDVNTPWEAVAEILRLSITGMQPGVEDWMARAKRVFGLAQDARKLKIQERKHAEDALAQLVTARALAASGVAAPVSGSAGLFLVGGGGHGQGAGKPPPPDGPSWTDSLRKKSDGDPTQTPYNVRVILRNHDDFRGCFRWNEVTKKVDVVDGPMLQYKHLDIDGLAAGVQDHLESAHKLVVGKDVIVRRLIDIARTNPYDPLKDFLNGLVWDGQKRITNWLRTYCGANKQPAEYLEKVGRRWMIALVARALDPGCKVDQVLVLEAPPGTGKCLGRGTPVLMFDGSVKHVEDIVSGDLLMGPDSLPRRVQSTTVGKGALRRIVPHKGDSWICNDKHILTVFSKTDNKTIDVEVSDCYTKFDQTCIRGNKKTKTNWSRLNQIRTGVEFASQAVSVDPYWVGLWLGDGTVDKAQITSTDNEIIEYCANYAPKHGLQAKVIASKGREYIKRIDFTTGREKGQIRAGRNPLLNFVRSLIINGEKRIPREFLINDRSKRLALLAGIVDTDGYYSTGGYEVITEYAGFRDDILFLARSLGFAAYASEKRVTKYPDRVYQRVFISGDISTVPCLLSRKKAAARKQVKDVLHTGFRIEDVGNGDFFGFQLDGDGRFLLGDFTVTHNSTVFNILGGEWYCDTAIELGDKDSRMMAGHYWICELAEIVAFKRTGHDVLKSYISSQVDKFRPPYGKEFEESKRRCMWVGTTNDELYFGDETGNRKYLPVACSYVAGMTEALRRDRLQLLAEAVAAYRAGESWHFRYEEIALTEAETEQRMVETPAKLKVESWWYGMAKSERPREGLTTLEVFEMAFDTTADRAKPGDLQAVGHALAKMKFRKARDSAPPRVWRHYATEELLNADRRPPPKRGGGPGLFVVQGGKKDEKPPIPPLPPNAK